MSLELIATFGKFFKAIFSSFGFVFKALFSKVGLAGLLGWKMFIFIFLATIYIGNSIGTAVQQHDAMIVVEDFGNFLLSTDSAIEKETLRVIDNQDTLTTWNYIFSFLIILSNFYMIYFMYHLLFQLFDWFSNTSIPYLNKFMWSSFIVLTMRAIYISVMIATERLSFVDDFNSSPLRVALPYHGIWLFLKNITLWSTPIVNFLNKV